MATLKSIAISSILVGERARPVDEDHALALAASMADRGLINPITVRPTPAANGGRTPYTLVAGGHRLWLRRSMAGTRSMRWWFPPMSSRRS